MLSGDSPTVSMMQPSLFSEFENKTKMAAESGGGGLIKVLGEYGVFLVEMGSLQDIYGSVKAMSRIKVSFDIFKLKFW
jgi:hypothetical protein